jgi:hypothetical protein
MFHVYPLPAYGIVALWMGLGTVALARHLALRSRPAVLTSGFLIALIGAIGSESTLQHDWAARYAAAILRSLPQNSILLVRGDPDLAPIGYLHLIEGVRPDVTLVQTEGVVLGNRLFHPLRTPPETARNRIEQLIRQASTPVVVTQWYADDYPRRDRWLYSLVEPAYWDSRAYWIDVPAEIVRFFEEGVLSEPLGDPWKAFLLGEMRRRFARLLAESLPRDKPPDEGARRLLFFVERDFHGSLGFVEGLMQDRKTYSVPLATHFLQQAGKLVPADASKQLRARYFELRGHLRLGQREPAGALADYETALSLWPVKQNGAAQALEELYRKMGNAAAAQMVRARLKG